MGVHPAIHGSNALDVDAAFVLPGYLERHHDQQLRNHLLNTARSEQTTLVLVRGSSCTGKTRTAFEAIRACLLDWQLVYPKNPEGLLALLDATPPAPRTVLWLNEAQNYLDGTNGEQAAARLHSLIESLGPVVILGTLWPEYHRALFATPQPGQDKKDAHLNARALLGQAVLIDVPDSFAIESLKNPLVSRDPSLAAAASTSFGGRITQALAAGPELVDYYKQATEPRGSYGCAVITAAMDARRLGHTSPLPAAFLKVAAPGYLTKEQRAAADPGAWFAQAVQYAEERVKGVASALEPVAQPVGMGRLPDIYNLNDYLDQHGRRTRCQQIPPATFWTAAAALTAPGDLVALATAAEDRGLLCDAARLHKRAARGDSKAAIALFRRMRSLHPTDQAAARWLSAHAHLGRSADAAGLLSALQEAGAHDQVAALIARDPATQADLTDPSAVDKLLHALRVAGAGEQVSVLASRAVAHVDLTDPSAVTGLLRVLCLAGAGEQVSVLASHAVAHVDLTDPSAVARLLRTLREAGAYDQVAALIARDPATHVGLTDPSAVTGLLHALQRVDALEQVAALIARDPAEYAGPTDPSAVAQLLDELREAGADQQVNVLASRTTAQADISSPFAVARLLRALHIANAQEWVNVLINRVSLGGLSNIVRLLEKLREAGADQQVSLLARRTAAHADLTDPSATAVLLYALRMTGAHDEVAALIARDPAEYAELTSLAAVAGLPQVSQRARVYDEIAALMARHPATHANLADPSAVARLLKALREVGADQQVNVLASRAAAHADVADPSAIAQLLDAFQEAGAHDQIAVLIARDPAAHADLSSPSAVARLLKALRTVGVPEQVAVLIARDPAVHANLAEGPTAAATLLHALQNSGADAQAAALTERLSAEGLFNIYYGLDNHQTRYRFGREHDGSPTPSWGWADLD